MRSDNLAPISAENLDFLEAIYGDEIVRVPVHFTPTTWMEMKLASASKEAAIRSNAKVSQAFAKKNQEQGKKK